MYGEVKAISAIDRRNRRLQSNLDQYAGSHRLLQESDASYAGELPRTSKQVCVAAKAGGGGGGVESTWI